MPSLEILPNSAGYPDLHDSVEFINLRCGGRFPIFHPHPHSIPHTKYLVSELCSSDICPCNILSCDDLSATFCLATFSPVNKPTGSVLDVSKVSIRFGFLLSGFASVSELTSVHTEFGAECNSVSNDTIFY